METRLKPLLDVSRAEDITGPRAWRRLPPEGEFRHSAARGRGRGNPRRSIRRPARELRKYGVRFGAYNIYFPHAAEACRRRSAAAALGSEERARSVDVECASCPSRRVRGSPRRRSMRRCPKRSIAPPASTFAAAAPCASTCWSVSPDRIRPLISWKPTEAQPEAPAGAAGSGAFRMLPEMMSIMGCSAEELGNILLVAWISQGAPSGEEAGAGQGCRSGAARGRCGGGRRALPKRRSRPLAVARAEAPESCRHAPSRRCGACGGTETSEAAPKPAPEERRRRLSKAEKRRRNTRKSGVSGASPGMKPTLAPPGKASGEERRTDGRDAKAADGPIAARRQPDPARTDLSRAANRALRPTRRPALRLEARRRAGKTPATQLKAAERPSGQPGQGGAGQPPWRTSERPGRRTRRQGPSAAMPDVGGDRQQHNRGPRTVVSARRRASRQRRRSIRILPFAALRQLKEKLERQAQDQA